MLKLFVASINIIKNLAINNLHKQFTKLDLLIVCAAVELVGHLHISLTAFG